MMSRTKNNAGFTLVELAISLMVIGLLIGGVLKGEEVLQNAKVAQGARQLAGIKAAVTTFRDTYGALPGDMNSPTTRLPNCTAAPCDVSGNEDRAINTTITSSNSAMTLDDTQERSGFWAHLNAAGLYSPQYSEATTLRAVAFPIGTSSMYVSSISFAASGSWEAAMGNYILVKSLAGAAPSTQMAQPAYAMSARQAAQMDSKIDNNMPHTGEFRAIGGTGCVVDPNYGSETRPVCNIMYRITKPY